MFEVVGGLTVWHSVLQHATARSSAPRGTATARVPGLCRAMPACTPTATGTFPCSTFDRSPTAFRPTCLQCLVGKSFIAISVLFYECQAPQSKEITQLRRFFIFLTVEALTISVINIISCNKFTFTALKKPVRVQRVSDSCHLSARVLSSASVFFFSPALASASVFVWSGCSTGGGPLVPRRKGTYTSQAYKNKHQEKKKTNLKRKG